MMSDNRDDADRFAAGTGGPDAERAEDDQMRPGVTGGGRNYLPETGRAEGDADRAEGTVGAVGEMDIGRAGRPRRRQRPERRHGAGHGRVKT